MIINVNSVPYDVCTKRVVKSILAIIMTLKNLNISLTKLRGLQHIPANSTLIAIEAAVILISLDLSTACEKGNKVSTFQH